MVAPIPGPQPSNAANPVAGAAPARSAASGQSTFSPTVYGIMPPGEVWGTFTCELRADRHGAAFEQLLQEARTNLKIDFRMLFGSPEADARRARLLRLIEGGLRVQALHYGRPGGAMAEAIKQARQDGIPVRVLPGSEGAPPPAAAATAWAILDDRLALALPEMRSETPRARTAAWRVTGPAASELGRVFNYQWAASGGHPQPLPEPLGPSGMQPSMSVATIAATEKVTVRSPRIVLLQALSQALSRVSAMLDGLDDPHVVEALIACAKRGVAVQVLLPGHAAFERASGAARAQLALQKAGASVRRFHQGGQPQSVELRYALVDLDQILMTGAAWTRPGLGAPDAWAIHAKGGRMAGQIEASFRSDWDSAVEAEPPSTGARLKGELAPAVDAFSRVVRKIAPTAQAAWKTEVGVVKLPGGFKVVTQPGAEP